MPISAVMAGARPGDNMYGNLNYPPAFDTEPPPFSDSEGEDDSFNGFVTAESVSESQVVGDVRNSNGSGDHFTKPPQWKAFYNGDTVNSDEEGNFHNEKFDDNDGWADFASFSAPESNASDETFVPGDIVSSIDNNEQTILPIEKTSIKILGSKSSHDGSKFVSSDFVNEQDKTEGANETSLDINNRTDELNEADSQTIPVDVNILERSASSGFIEEYGAEKQKSGNLVVKNNVTSEDLGTKSGGEHDKCSTILSSFDEEFVSYNDNFRKPTVDPSTVEICNERDSSMGGSGEIPGTAIKDGGGKEVSHSNSLDEEDFGSFKETFYEPTVDSPGENPNSERNTVNAKDQGIPIKDSKCNDNEDISADANLDDEEFGSFKEVFYEPCVKSLEDKLCTEGSSDTDKEQGFSIKDSKSDDSKETFMTTGPDEDEFGSFKETLYEAKFDYSKEETCSQSNSIDNDKDYPITTNCEDSGIAGNEDINQIDSSEESGGVSYPSELTQSGSSLSSTKQSDANDYTIKSNDVTTSTLDVEDSLSKDQIIKCNQVENRMKSMDSGDAKDTLESLPNKSVDDCDDWATFESFNPDKTSFNTNDNTLSALKTDDSTMPSNGNHSEEQNVFTREESEFDGSEDWSTFSVGTKEDDLGSEVISDRPEAIKESTENDEDDWASFSSFESSKPVSNDVDLPSEKELKDEGNSNEGDVFDDWASFSTFKDNSEIGTGANELSTNNESKEDQKFKLASDSDKATFDDKNMNALKIQATETQPTSLPLGLCFVSSSPLSDEQQHFTRRKSQALELVISDKYLQGEGSIWTQLKKAADKEGSYKVTYSSSFGMKWMLSTMNLAFENPLPRKTHTKSPSLTTPQTLSPASSIGSFDIPEAALEPVPVLLSDVYIRPDLGRQTLLAQSQWKDEKGNAVRRVASSSSLKKDSGSETTSETNSLDLEFFSSGSGNVAIGNTQVVKGEQTLSTFGLDLLEVNFNAPVDPVSKDSERNADNSVQFDVQSGDTMALKSISEVKGSSVSLQEKTAGSTNTSTLGTAATNFLSDLEDLNYVTSSVLMFPSTLLQDHG